MIDISDGLSSKYYIFVNKVMVVVHSNKLACSNKKKLMIQHYLLNIDPITCALKWRRL